MCSCVIQSVSGAFSHSLLTLKSDQSSPCQEELGGFSWKWISKGLLRMNGGKNVCREVTEFTFRANKS